MIYTVTFNPSLDYVMYVDKIVEGETNRSSRETLTVGGKGLNVSMVLNNLGTKSTALGFIAGFTGKYILEQFNTKGINNDFIYIDDSISRINIKLKTTTESEINANGPNYTQDEISKIMEKINNLKSGDILVLAGSIPKSLPDTIYSEIMEMLQEKDIKIVVDATGKLLMNVLKYRPFLIKPNMNELEELFRTKITSEDELYKQANKLLELGAQNVIVSLGSEGAIFVNNDMKLHINSPKGQLVNSVGSGDSMVAGFLHGIVNNMTYEESFKYSVACGSATAFSKELAPLDKVNELLLEIK